MPNPSPLRYPGGKHRLAGFIQLAIQNLNMPDCTYVEPFAGGAGVALSLLLDGTVNRIVINDYDKAIYSFWRAVRQEPTSLIDLIQNTPVTIDEWHRQKEIYLTSTAYSLDLAFATLFLNRTNRSGILNAGPIGGYAQDGEWKLDVRFDKEAIIAKIELIAKERERITVYNKALRFWNAESRAKGAGYVQLPVYFLSLSRIFPIGETGKTQAMPITLTPEELDYCIANYRTIMPKNVSTSAELNQVLNDINLSVPIGSSKINIYCEDARAVSFLQHILSSNLHVNLDLYMSFVDINLGWPNYVQLVEKGIPEFKNNMIVLDGDVQQMDEYAAKAARTVQNAGNIIFLPLVIEKGIFALLKNHEAFLRFQEAFSRVPGFTYDVCFNSWPLDVSSYNTNDFKKWYSYAESTLGDTTILFDFWCSEHQDNISTFVERFVDVFNRLAERNSVDAIPTITHNDNGENVAIPQAEV